MIKEMKMVNDTVPDCQILQNWYVKHGEQKGNGPSSGQPKEEFTLLAEGKKKTTESQQN